MAKTIKVVGGKVKTTLRLPESIYWDLQAAKTAQRISSDEAAFAAVITEGMASWEAAGLLRGAGTKPPPVLEPVGNKESGKSPLSFAHSPWHSKLQHILDSGSEDAIEAVTRNLDVFYDYVAIREREQTAASKSLPGAGAQKTAQPGGTETTDPKHGQDLRKGKPRSA